MSGVKVHSAVSKTSVRIILPSINSGNFVSSLFPAIEIAATEASTYEVPTKLLFTIDFSISFLSGPSFQRPDASLDHVDP